MMAESEAKKIGDRMRQAGILIGVMVCMFIPGPAQGYVLKGPHILQLMIKRLGSAQQLMVVQKIVIQHADDLAKSIELTETLHYLFPDKFRSEIQSPDTKRVYVLSQKTVVAVVDGKVVDHLETPFDFYKDVLLFRKRILLAERLTQHGINLKISSLGRIQKRVGFVIGAQYPDVSVPQLWVDKETFQPLRWIIRGATVANSEPELEVRYQNWQKIMSLWYPMEIDFYHNGSLFRRLQVNDIKINSPVASELFDPQRLRALYPPISADRPKAAEPSAVDEVKKTIEEFKKIYE